MKVVPNNSTIKLEPIRPSKLLTTLWFCHMIVGYCWYMLVWLTSGSWFFRVCHLGRWFHLTDIFRERLGWVAVPKFHKPWIYQKNSHATYALCMYIYIYTYNNYIMCIHTKHVPCNPLVRPHSNNTSKQYDILITRGWMKTLAMRSDFDFKFWGFRASILGFRF